MKQQLIWWKISDNVRTCGICHCHGSAAVINYHHSRLTNKSERPNNAAGQNIKLTGYLAQADHVAEFVIIGNSLDKR